MQGVTAGSHRQVDDAVGVQISGHGIGADVIGFIGLFEMKTVSIRVGINCNRSYTHFGAGTYDTHCNFTAICNKYFINQGRRRLWLDNPTLDLSTGDQGKPVSDVGMGGFPFPFMIFLEFGNPSRNS